LNDLYDYISKGLVLSEEAKEYINSISKEKRVKKNDILIRQGQKVNKTYFVVTGCLRSYGTDREGKDHTMQFAIKNWWISDFMAWFEDKPTSLTIECVTDSMLIEIKISDLEELYKRFPVFESFQRKNLEKHLASIQKRLLNQLQLSAEERYAVFLEKYPEIEKHALNYHIASYLGITQQSLSRIRSEKNKSINLS
jgi:CRP-like cAMP-binding protein